MCKRKDHIYYQLEPLWFIAFPLFPTIGNSHCDCNEPKRLMGDQARQVGKVFLHLLLKREGFSRCIVECQEHHILPSTKVDVFNLTMVVVAHTQAICVLFTKPMDEGPWNVFITHSANNYQLLMQLNSPTCSLLQFYGRWPTKSQYSF